MGHKVAENAFVPVVFQGDLRGQKDGWIGG